MAKTKHSRRSVSVRGATYDALGAYAEQHHLSMSEIVEQQLAKVLGTSAPLYPEKPAPPVVSRRLLQHRTPSEAREARRETRRRFNPPPMPKPKPEEVESREKHAPAAL